MKHLQDRHVLVLGLGASGLAMARWCARHGAHVTVADTREAPPQLAALREAAARARLRRRPVRGRAGRGHAGACRLSLARACRRRTSRRWPMRRARIGLPVGGELDLFAQALADLRSRSGYATPAVLAITGTNGKTTVTALTGQLVERAGKTVAVAGNIGPTLLDTLARAARRRHAAARSGCSSCPASSSTACRASSPRPPAVLNITQDHLDWHGDMAAYAAAKARIFGASGADGAQPRRPGRDADAAGTGAGSSCSARSSASTSPSAPTCRSGPAISASSASTAWPGWCARTRPTKRTGPSAAQAPMKKRSTCSA